MSYQKKILRVNLSSGNISEEPLDMKLAREYLGGRGLGTKILYDEIDPSIDPLSEENKLIFATGPLTATNILNLIHGSNSIYLSYPRSNPI